MHMKSSSQHMNFHRNWSRVMKSEIGSLFCLLSLSLSLSLPCSLTLLSGEKMKMTNDKKSATQIIQGLLFIIAGGSLTNVHTRFFVSSNKKKWKSWLKRYTEDESYKKKSLPIKWLTFPFTSIKNYPQWNGSAVTSRFGHIKVMMEHDCISI